MRAIPNLFRLDEYLGGKASDQPFNRFARQILSGDEAWVPRRKRNGVPALLDEYGNWHKGAEVHYKERLPRGFVETHCGSRLADGAVPELRFGWVPADDARITLLRQALLVDAPELIPGETYELCGPGICGNMERLSAPRLFRHAATEVCLDLFARPSTYQSLRAHFRTKLLADGWEGIVWHGRLLHAAEAPDVPHAIMMKLRVDDFVPI